MKSRLKRFPVAEVRPRVGTISAMLWANENASLPLTLFHAITIPLQPFVAETWEGKARYQTSLRLDFIELDLPFGGYRALQGRSFRFPRNPQPGYVDGSVYLGGAHNPVNVDALSFGKARGRTIEVRVRAALDFEHEGIGLRNVANYSLSTTLRFGALLVPSDLLVRKRDKRVAAHALASRFIVEGTYGAPKLEQSAVSLPHL